MNNRTDHNLVERIRRKNISEEFQLLKVAIGLSKNKPISKENILKQAFQYIHSLKTLHNNFLFEINKIEAINEELKSRVTYLEKLLNDELKDSESYNDFTGKILQNNVATNEIKVSVNEELKSSVLFLEKILQEKEVETEKMKSEILLLEKNLNEKEADFLEKEKINEERFNEIKFQIEHDSLTQITELKIKNELLECENNKLIKQLQQFCNKERKGSNSKKVANSKQEMFRNKILHLRIELSEKNQCISGLNNYINEKDNEIKNLSNGIKELEQMINFERVTFLNENRHLRCELDKKNQCVSDLNDGINENENKIKKLSEVIKELEQIIDSEGKMILSKYRHFRNELDEKNQNVRDLNDDINEKNNVIKKLIRMIKEFDFEREVIQNKNQHLRFELGEKNQSVRDLNDDINKKDNEIKKLISIIKELELINNSKRNEIEEFHNWYMSTVVQGYSNIF